MLNFGHDNNHGILPSACQRTGREAGLSAGGGSATRRHARQNARRLRQHLASDAVTYGAFKVSVGGTNKHVFISAIGPNAGGMVKGRATAHTQSVENALEGTVVGIQVAEEEEFEADVVAEKLSQALKKPVMLCNWKRH